MILTKHERKTTKVYIVRWVERMDLSLLTLEALRELLNPGKEVAALHVWTEDLGDDETLYEKEYR